MPLVATLLMNDHILTVAGEDENTPATIEPAEDICLYLPSLLPDNLRYSAEIKSLAEKECRLRFAQADEALENIKKGRRMITGLYQFKKLNISGAGNKPNTKMQTLYNRLQARIKCAADCYHATRSTLLALNPDGSWKDKYKKLNTEDIRGPGRNKDDPTQSQSGRYEMS